LCRKAAVRLNRPGGNVTGSAILTAELVLKQLQVPHELMPNASRFGVLADPASLPTQSILGNLPAAARVLGLQLSIVNARTDSDLENAFVTFSQERVDAILVVSSALYNRRIKQLATLATSHALPAMCPYPEYAMAGGLMSYGSTFGYFYHQAGLYTGRILKGEKPADLAVEQTTRIKLTLWSGF
jgi:putative ABC transport system substrate-binding protein